MGVWGAGNECRRYDFDAGDRAGGSREEQGEILFGIRMNFYRLCDNASEAHVEG